MVVRRGCPLLVPAGPVGSLPVSVGVDIGEGDDGGAVFTIESKNA